MALDARAAKACDLLAPRPSAAIIRQQTADVHSFETDCEANLAVRDRFPAHRPHPKARDAQLRVGLRNIQAVWIARDKRPVARAEASRIGPESHPRAAGKIDCGRLRSPETVCSDVSSIVTSVSLTHYGQVTSSPIEATGDASSTRVCP